MTKLRVLHIIPSFDVGGAEKVVLTYLQSAESTNIQFRAISLYADRNTIYNKQISKEGLDVIYLDKHLGYDFGIILKIRKQIKAFDPNVVHCHLRTMKYIIPAMIGLNKRIKYFYTFHSIIESENKGLVDRFFNKIAFRFSHIVPIALNNTQLAKINRYYSISSTRIIPNSIDVKRYVVDESIRKQKRSDLNIDDEFVLGHVGRFDLVKNHSFILAVFCELIKVNKNSKLLLVGGGSLLEEIRSKVVELGLLSNVIFAGSCYDIPSYMQAMDAFIFPSLYEGLGIVAIEAQASSLPCLASDKVPREVKITNLLEFESLDAHPQVWAEKILCMAEVNVRKDMSIFISNAGYSIEKMIQQLENLYNNA